MKKKLRITVKGQTYDVIAEILDDEVSSTETAAPSAQPAATVAPDAVIQKTAPAAKQPVAAAGDGEIQSPVAGTVISLAKKVGETVAEGDVVLILEAMKMETAINAPCAGTIKSVAVNQGDTVEEGQLLASIA